jgi:glycosyltransferase involved in cell wall biosynthesis
MRVTHIITRLTVGGAQENTIASVLGLNRKPAIQAELVSGPSIGPEGSLEGAFAHQSHLLTHVETLVRPVRPLKDFSAFRELTRLLSERKPDIVHTHSGKAGVIGRLAASRAGVPLVIHTIHGPSFGPFQGRLANIIFTAAEKHAARATHHFVSVAEAMTQQYLAAGIGKPDQYTRIFSGFNLTPFLDTKNDLNLRARFGIGPDDIVIGKIARLFELKGHYDLFAVAPQLVSRCPQIKFLLVGDGELRPKFQQQIHDLGLQKNFVFTGLVPPGEVSSLIGIMDIVVHLSQREGLPRALSQSLAAAKPVVAYDSDGAKEVCFDNKTGFLIRIGHLNALTERLLLLVQDPQLREQLGRQGQKFVREHFSVEQMVDGLYNLYLKLVNERGLKTA